MKYWCVPLVFSIITATQLNAQEDESCTPPSKKVLKLLAAVQEADAQTAAMKFQEAMKLEPEKAMVYFENASYVYEAGTRAFNVDPKLGEKQYLKAESMFKKTIELCSDYHADCYYNLGYIKYTQQDMPEAVKYFKEFVAYKNDDNSRYPEDYGTKLAQVKKALDKLEESVAIDSESVPFEPKIVRYVSTDRDEFFPMISPDNGLMFFTRRKPLDEHSIHGRKSIHELFSISERTSVHAPFSEGEEIDAPFNTGEFKSYGAATLSVDNKEMIICACKDTSVVTGSGPTAYTNCDLYSTTYIRTGEGGNDYKWTPLKNLGKNINKGTAWEGQPSLSSDGNTLYYTKNGPDTRNNDIFVSERQSDGSWGKARPFHHVNTDGKDKSPFLHQDSETFYFVSESTKQRPGRGGLDIYYIRKENGAWTEPKNIGYPINTEGDELGLFVSIDGEIAYYSSFQNNVWNIYSFELYEEARPQAMSILKGDLKDENGDAVEGATIEVLYEGTDEVTEVKVKGNDGTFATVVKKQPQGDVMVTVKKEGYAFDSKVVAREDLASADEPTIKNNDLDVRKLEAGGKYEINDILYTTASYSLSDRSKFTLQGFARFLKENPSIKVAIHGHTDDEGHDETNRILSDNRAKGVQSYLISLGIDKHRLSAKGFGEKHPKVPNTSAANRAKNRRTEFLIEQL